MKVLFALLALSLAPLAFGQGMGMGMGMRIPADFAALDIDGDGKLTKEELGKVAPAERLDQVFSRWDADEDGSVTEEEFNNRPGPPGGMGMGG
ncbi:MAG: EF-hand domain-containing protein [Gammaproteobacteria bacterium]|nr:EF-hand domain-containing protein [Gammaproteobacteria bacterium]